MSPASFRPPATPNDTRDPYEPVNYDRKFHGPVLARTALGSSYNVPAVKALDYVGIYDDPDTPQEDGFIAFAERMGITTLTRDDYGLSLTLGGGDVSLIGIGLAPYTVFANGGQRAQPYAIERIEDHSGNVVYQHEDRSEQVILADHAYLISSILSGQRCANACLWFKLSAAPAILCGGKRRVPATIIGITGHWATRLISLLGSGSGTPITLP